MTSESQHLLFPEAGPPASLIPPPTCARPKVRPAPRAEAHGEAPNAKTSRRTRQRDNTPRPPSEEEMLLRSQFEADREGFIDDVILGMARGMFDNVESSYHVRELRDFGATDEGAAKVFGTYYELGTLRLSVTAGASPFIKAENATGLFFTLEAAEFGARLRRLVPFPQPVTPDERLAVMERRFAEGKSRLAAECPEMVSRLLAISDVKTPASPAVGRSKKKAPKESLFGPPESTPAQEIGARLYDFALDTPEGEGAACGFALEVLMRRGVSAKRPSKLLRAVGQMIEHACLLYTLERERAGLRRAPETDG